MRKRVSIVVVAMLCACCLAFAACGGSSASSSATSASGSATSSASAASANADEQAIVKDIETNATWFEDNKSQIADEIAADKDTSDMLALVGVDAKEFGQAFADGMSMKCGKVTVNGDKAVAEILITAPDSEAMNVEMDKALEELDVQSLSGNEALNKVGEAIMKAVKNTPTKEVAIEVDYVKNNGTWEVADIDKLKSAMQKALV